jgi:hypothetical protein
MHVSGSGSGEFVIPNEECPLGHEWCDKTKACVQKCINCNYKGGMKSLVFPDVSDQCFLGGGGVFNGMDNWGNTKCTCGTNNQYCPDYLINPNTGIGDYIIQNEDGVLPRGISEYRSLHQNYSDEYPLPSGGGDRPDPDVPDRPGQPNACSDMDCGNGKCVLVGAGLIAQCDCKRGYKGEYCEIDKSMICTKRLPVPKRFKGTAKEGVYLGFRKECERILDPGKCIAHMPPPPVDDIGPCDWRPG